MNLKIFHLFLRFLKKRYLPPGSTGQLHTGEPIPPPRLHAPPPHPHLFPGEAKQQSPALFSLTPDQPAQNSNCGPRAMAGGAGGWESLALSPQGQKVTSEQLGNKRLFLATKQRGPEVGGRKWGGAGEKGGQKGLSGGGGTASGLCGG